MVGSEYCLSHISPIDGKGESIASSHYKYRTEKNLQGIGSDGRAVITGRSGVTIRILDERLGRPLQWSIRLLDCNELPLRYVFRLLDGKITCPDCFSRKLGKMIGEVVSNWDVKDFKPIVCESKGSHGHGKSWKNKFS